MTDDDWPFESVDTRPWLVSATDLLVSWAPSEVAQESGRPSWDQYFAQPSRVAPSVDELPGEEPWDTGAAELVVDCLYQFLHAVERGDVDAAMACVDDDYHAIENDREVDRDGLRLGLESLLDQWRGSDFHVTLAEIPEPVFHPAGVLIRVTIQVDFTAPLRGRMRTDLFGRVVLFREHPNGEWAITGMAVTE